MFLPESTFAIFCDGSTRRLVGGTRAMRDALEAVGLSALADLPANAVGGATAAAGGGAAGVAPGADWLLDEPTLGLDAASVTRFGSMLGAHRGSGGGCWPHPSAAAAAGSRRTGAGMSLFVTLLARELRLSLRHGSDTLAALLFFVLAAALFPLAIGPAPETLGRIAPGIVYVCALLAALLPLDRLFGADLEDGRSITCCSAACRRRQSRW